MVLLDRYVGKHVVLSTLLVMGLLFLVLGIWVV